ncbi:hypothetical protein [Streptomyces griseorubiginosus]|uniref:hypothetical protein n=1 Tax=Streptomyces griseorubiginosus TaxID=67304 RepID=UPI0036EE868C
MSSNKLIAAGSSRLKKAADSAVDPAVPAELQKQAAAHVATADTSAPEPSIFAHGRVLSADDITGTPEEQLAFITGRLHEIDLLGKRAEDFTVLNKAVLLEVARDRDLHVVAGYTNFSVWAADVLDVEPKYVFELLQDAERIRAISELGPDLVQHLTRASARKVMAEVISGQGLETAQVVMSEGVAKAAQEGKRRPTAALLASIAKELTSPSIPAQEQRSEISDPPSSVPSVPSEITALERAAIALKERAYAPLAPAAVQAALDADPEAVREHLASLEKELGRIAKRLTAAQRLAASSAEPAEAAS